MENYIVINGKKAELTEEQLEKLGIEPEKPEEKYPAKFKVGDRVKVIRSTRTLGREEEYGRNEEYEGKTFTIKFVYRLSDYPNGPARAYSVGENYVVYENELESAPYEEMFERGLDTYYYYIDTTDSVLKEKEDYHRVDTGFYAVGNYCKDEKVMRQRALHETLNRLLWRASIIAGEMDNPWYKDNYHYYIFYDKSSDALQIGSNYVCHIQGICYFPSEESAQSAIDKIVKPFIKEHPDFVW